MPAIIAISLIHALQSAEVDANRLSIGRPGTAVIQPGQVWDLRNNRACTMADIIQAADGKRFVFLGEQHATTAHQQMEADVVQALDAAKRQVIVGMEMFTRPKQDVLDQWSAGALNEDQFLEQSDWKGQWGYDYKFYRPVFEVAKGHHLPVVGLNVPRGWVRTVGKTGFNSLPVSARMQLPESLFLGNKVHREVFDAMVGPHNMPGMNADSMYGAQVLWDEGMADTAIKYLNCTPTTPQTVFVVIAGSGHMMYGQGINYRINRRRAGKGLNLVMVESDKAVELSRGIADFAYVSQKPAGK